MKNHMTPVKASAKTPLTREAFLAEVKKLDIKTTSQQLLAALSLAGQIALNQPNPQGKTLQVQAMEAKEENDLISQVTQEEHEEIMDKNQTNSLKDREMEMMINALKKHNNKNDYCARFA